MYSLFVKYIDPLVTQKTILKAFARKYDLYLIATQYLLKAHLRTLILVHKRYVCFLKNKKQNNSFEDFYQFFTQ